MGSTSPEQFSLFDTLTGSKSANHHAATSLILNLLKAVGYEACQTDRNTHYLYSVVSDIRDAYDSVNDWIDRVDSGNGDIWTLFNNYTNAIDPLEERLSRLFQLLKEDYNKEQTYTSDDDLGSCFDLVELFETIRGELGTTVEKLGQYFAEGDKSSKSRSLFGDDYLYIQSLRNKLDKKQVMGKRYLRKFRQENDKTIKLLENWSTGPPQGATADKIAIKGIQVWMIVYSVIDKGTAPSASSKLKALINTEELWNELYKTTVLVNEYLQAPSKPFEKLENNYKALIEYLKTSAVIVLARGQKSESELISLPPQPSLSRLPDTYLKVIKLVAKTGRPYFAQAVILAKECQKLSSTYSAKPLDQRHEIEEVFTKVEVALKSAEDHRSHNASAKLEVSDDVDKKFKEAHEQAKDCFQSLELTNDWDELDRGMKTAKANDTQRKQDFESYVKAHASQQSLPHQSFITVTIETRASKGSTEGVLHSYKVEKTTRLSTLLWDRIRSEARPAGLNVKAYFTKKDSPNRERLDSDMKIEEVDPNTPQLTLVLVIPT
ncbi:hypothetical protein E1B28_011396 [Marasmius oreades]|uniref:Uncharacterized protein n=1 Tax=Marasmius oreades TaxID=181124 RepID=A0A9P7RU72_9AGAR|nr:uncharacterized protein E1B28_011396 [Marasmius oreades]KAG7089742.1 hypothetical protein E1B28_011396 [Marasmius oreades]